MFPTDFTTWGLVKGPRAKTLTSKQPNINTINKESEQLYVFVLSNIICKYNIKNFVIALNHLMLKSERHNM